MADLKAAAHEYWSQGCNIVPLKGKQPLVSWSQWQIQRQSQEEFEGLPWSQADGFAIICGTQLSNGLFFGALDFDVKNVTEEAKDKGKKALKNILCTHIEETPSGGQHWIFYSKVKPKTVSAYHNEASLELLGEGKLCIMAPSQGYKRLNDNTPSEVQDLETSFIEALSTVGVRTQKEETATWFERKELATQAYKGKEPNCIRELEKGAKEGLRNEYGIRLASYYGNCKQYKTESCLKILKMWNKLNEPSLDTEEIESLLKSALQGNYVYGCNDPILKEVCKREGCSLAKKEAKEVTEQEKAIAEKLLADPKLLDYVLVFGRKRLIGEDNILLQNFVILVSGQTKYSISEVLSGHSGSGKNESIRAIKPLIPEEGWIFEFTTSTPEAIKYIPEDFSGTLVIYELAGIRSETGTLGLRSIGEGEGIKTIYPMRDEQTGEMTLGEKQTNAKNFISTESGLDIQADLYRRVFKNSMNDSLALTKRVCAKKMRDSSLPESLRSKLYPEQSKLPYSAKDFRNALSMLDLKLEVVIFPPSSLLELIGLATKREQQVALRTQIERILNFIKILALIHQKQRIHFKDDADSYVIADVRDVETALTILETSINETVTRMEKRQKEAIEILKKFPSGLDKNSLATKLNCSPVTAARILKTIANQGYAKQIETIKPYLYQLVEEKTPNAFVLPEKISQYQAIYPTELKTFLNSILSPCQVATHKFFSVEIPEELENKYHIATMTSDKEPTDKELKPIPETKPNPLVEPERTSENSLEISNSVTKPSERQVLESKNGEVEKGPGQRLSIQEMLELLHNELPKGREFTEQQFLDCVVKHGWTREDHDAFFQKLVDEGILLRTPGGGYIWM
jgi:hypothetical protein